MLLWVVPLMTVFLCLCCCVCAVGSLTCHELTHGADMVIRQTVDPYFHWEVQAHTYTTYCLKESPYNTTSLRQPFYPPCLCVCMWCIIF